MITPGLIDLVNAEHPLGPLDQISFRDPEDAAAILETAAPLLLAHKRHYTLIYGRKGMCGDKIGRKRIDCGPSEMEVRYV